MDEGHEATRLHLVLEGVFELVKTVEYVDKEIERDFFPLKELLP